MFRLVALSLWVVLGLSAVAQPVDLITTQRVVVYDEAKSGLNSDKKQKLRLICTGQAVNPCFFLDSDTRLKPLTRGSFVTREVISDVATGRAMQEMKVVYHCALVEVLQGASKGRRGWVVLAREVVGRYSDVWIRPDEPDPSEPKPEPEPEPKAPDQRAL